MSEYPHNQEPFTNEAEPVPATRRKTGNGARPRRAPKTAARPVPGLDLRALIAERNVAALAGLALLALGALLLVQDILGISFSLWGLALLGIGGWFMLEAWQSYEQQNRHWTDTARNRMVGGALIVMIAVMSMVSFNWWALMLLVAGGWLGYDTWQRYAANGHTLDQTIRNRGLAAALIGAIGLVSFFNLGSAWPLVLIVIGGAMIYRHLSA